MAVSGFLLVFMAALFYRNISGSYVPRGLTAEKRAYSLSCDGVIKDVAEPISPDSSNSLDYLDDLVNNFQYDKDCFMCSGNCYTLENIKRDRKTQEVCYKSYGIHKQTQALCQALAKFWNKKNECVGGDYRCFDERVHEQKLEWKPICVCRSESSGGSCKKYVTVARKCSIAVQDEEPRECDCQVEVELQHSYAK